jgi:putative addiction module component (TIGR02574 family)
MKTTDILNEAISLPVEERAKLVDSLLKTLNSPSLNIDKQWTKIAKRRLMELRSGEVKAVPGEEVFRRIWERFSA